MIASVLIAQDADATPGTQEVNHWLEALLAIEQFQAGAAPGSTNVLINEAISEALIYTPVSDVADKLRHQLGKQFPYGEMAQRENHRYAGPEPTVHGVDIFDIDPP